MASTLVFNPNSELLEGPVFDLENNYLYFVSILDGLVFCYNPDTKEILSVRLDSPVSCVYIQANKKVLAASINGFYAIDFNTLKKEFVFQIEIGAKVRYNDGIQDARGRYLIGTMGYPTVNEGMGRVFSYLDGKYQCIIENTTISNGLAFSKDNTVLYFIDTPTRKVAKYHYDIDTGEVTFDSHIIEFNGQGSPDGMCMDDDGMLWIAEWAGGWCIPLGSIKWEKNSVSKNSMHQCNILLHR